MHFCDGAFISTVWRSFCIALHRTILCLSAKKTEFTGVQEGFIEVLGQVDCSAVKCLVAREPGVKTLPGDRVHRRARRAVNQKTFVEICSYVFVRASDTCMPHMNVPCQGNTIQYNPGICIAPPTTRPVAHYKEMTTTTTEV